MIRAAITKEGSLALSPLQKNFLAKYSGKEAKIEVDDRPTTEKRGYLHGGLVRAIFYQHPYAGWKNFNECYEALMLEFAPYWTKDLKGNAVKSRKSSADGNMSNLQLGKLIDHIVAWMEENHYQIPDPQEFKNWRDSAQDTPYPFLERLKEHYLAQLEKRKTRTPWRR